MHKANQQGWDIIGVLNCDMISYAVTTTDGSNLIVYENTASEWLYTFTNNMNTEYIDYTQLTLHHGGSIWGSDHNSFWDQGYDALFYFEYTETPYYHTSQDTMAHINASYAVKNICLCICDPSGDDWRFIQEQPSDGVTSPAQRLCHQCRLHILYGRH